jgi:hypothetical protein
MGLVYRPNLLHPLGTQMTNHIREREIQVGPTSQYLYPSAQRPNRLFGSLLRSPTQATEGSEPWRQSASSNPSPP